MVLKTGKMLLKEVPKDLRDRKPNASTLKELKMNFLEIFITKWSFLSASSENFVGKMVTLTKFTSTLGGINRVIQREKSMLKWVNELYFELKKN